MPPLLYMSGLSYRAMTYQTRSVGASRVSVYNWVHALKDVVSRAPRKRRGGSWRWTRRSSRSTGRQVYVWAAIDIDTKELLAVYASYYRSHINAIAFLRMVLRTCRNRPLVLVDGGPWYPWPLGVMGFGWLRATFGQRNAIERFFRTLKERTGRFYNNLTPHKLENMQSFMDVFLLWYNRLRRHQTPRTSPSEVTS